MFQHITTLEMTPQTTPLSTDNILKMLFFTQERLKALTDIVWPEIALLVKNLISQAREEGMDLHLFILVL